MAPAPSKLEINFQRLLGRCEAMASEYQDNKETVSWRLDKYVMALHKQVTELAKGDSKPCPSTMSEYMRRVDFLKAMIESEKLSCPSEKLMASQQLNVIKPSSPIESGQKNRGRQLQLKTRSHLEKDMREELLGSEGAKESGGLRNRRLGGDQGSEKEESVDAVLQHHQNTQEKIADEMVKMAQSLKHTSMVASNIIKEDNKSLEASTKLADSNFEKLKRESERLEEINQRPCSMWIWLMLIVVCVVFMMMIVFIRIVPKKY